MSLKTMAEAVASIFSRRRNKIKANSWLPETTGQYHCILRDTVFLRSSERLCGFESSHPDIMSLPFDLKGLQKLAKAEDRYMEEMPLRDIDSIGDAFAAAVPRGIRRLAATAHGARLVTKYRDGLHCAMFQNNKALYGFKDHVKEAAFEQAIEFFHR